MLNLWVLKNKTKQILWRCIVSIKLRRWSWVRLLVVQWVQQLGHLIQGQAENLRLGTPENIHLLWIVISNCFYYTWDFFLLMEHAFFIRRWSGQFKPNPFLSASQELFILALVCNPSKIRWLYVAAKTAGAEISFLTLEIWDEHISEMSDICSANLQQRMDWWLK